MKESFSRIGFGIFVGTIGYVAAGIANDSNICTAPVFWVLMGLGMSLNRLIAEQDNLFSIPIPVDAEETILEPTASKQQSHVKREKKKSRKQRKNK